MSIKELDQLLEGWPIRIIIKSYRVEKRMKENRFSFQKKWTNEFSRSIDEKNESLGFPLPRPVDIDH